MRLLGLNRWPRSTEILVEDALKQCLAARDRKEPLSTSTLANALGISVRRALAVAELMIRRRLARWKRGGLHLTGTGERRALHVRRAHRLWESYLADHANMPLEGVHREAEWREHHSSPEELDHLEADLGFPTRDPHGDPIPSRDGIVDVPSVCSLDRWPAGRPAVVVHVEDEPPELMREALQAGLRPGARLIVLGRSSTATKMRVYGQDRELLMPVCAAVDVREAAPDEVDQRARLRLSDVIRGQTAKVLSIAEECRGLIRRRLLDLGVTPGVSVTVEMENVGRSTTAYRIRDTVIALRREQADQVLVEPAAPCAGSTDTSKRFEP